MIKGLLAVSTVAIGMGAFTWPSHAGDRQPDLFREAAYRTGAIGGVLDTSRTGYARIAEAFDLDLAEDFTIEVRARFDRFEGHQEIVAKTSAWDRDGFVFKLRDRTLEFIRGGEGGKVATTTGSYSVAKVVFEDAEPGRTYDLAVAKKASTVEFFVDGKPLGQGSIGALVPTRAALTISTPWAGGHLDGQVDELRIWREARDAADIAADARRQLAGNEANLAALYRFDGVDRQIVKDASRSGYHGELVGNAVLIRSAIIPASRPKPEER